MNPYSKGLEFLCRLNLLKPTQDFVLLKAILATDNNRAGIEVMGTDTKTAVCHEVVSLGPDVRQVALGDHCLHISAAGDAVDETAAGKEGRYVLVREQDIPARWNATEAEAAAKQIGLA